MDYKKKYDKALEKSKEFYALCKKCGAKSTVDFLEDKKTIPNEISRFAVTCDDELIEQLEKNMIEL